MKWRSARAQSMPGVVSIGLIVSVAQSIAQSDPSSAAARFFNKEDLFPNPADSSVPSLSGGAIGQTSSNATETVRNADGTRTIRVLVAPTAMRDGLGVRRGVRTDLVDAFGPGTELDYEILTDAVEESIVLESRSVGAEECTFRFPIFAEGLVARAGNDGAFNFVDGAAHQWAFAPSRVGSEPSDGPSGFHGQRLVVDSSGSVDERRPCVELRSPGRHLHGSAVHDGPRHRYGVPLHDQHRWLAGHHASADAGAARQPLTYGAFGGLRGRSAGP